MENKDLAIIYKAKQKEVKDIIKKLNSSSIDLSDKLEEIELIDKKLKEKIKKENSIDIYEESFDKIDLIINDIKDNYECYYKIYVLYKDLKQKLINVNADSINELVLISKELLSQVKQSSTIDFEKEQELVLKIYEAIYSVLKLELLYLDKDSLLELLKENDVDVSFISELIEKDLSSIRDNNESIEQEILKVQKNGLDNKYLLNKELLSLIIILDKENDKAKKKDDFLTSMSDYEIISKKMEMSIDRMEKKSKEIPECKKGIRKLKKKRFLSFTIGLINLTLIGTGVFFSSKLSKKMSEEKNYHTITTTYDSSIDEEVVDESYATGKNENLTIVEYSPWDSPGSFRSDYKRNKYEYETKNLNVEFDDLKDYLNNNIKFEDNDIKKSEEVVKQKPDDYGYGENKYIIIKTEKDLADYKYIVNSKKNILFDILLKVSLASSGISYAIYLLKKSGKEKGKIVDKKEELEELKKELEIIKNELQELLLKHNNMPKELLERYYDLGPVIIRDRKVKEAKDKINRLINN